MADDEITTLYLADRADGSAIYQVNMALLAGISTYGALVVAAISTSAVSPWVRAFVGVPLWGLLCYQCMLLGLSTVRVNSINILEEKLLSRTGLGDVEKGQIGSDAGDWVSNIKHQPVGLRPANVAAFGSFALAATVVAVMSLLSVLEDDRPNCVAFFFGAVAHVVLAGFLISAARTVFFGDLIKCLKDRAKYPRP